MARRLAILIGNQRFAPDSGFAELRGPHNDVDALAAILTDPARGGFELAEPPLKDASRLAIMDVIRLALHEATADDTLLIHYSGHGKPDAKGRLHFAAADSKAGRLRDTALRAEDLHEAVGESRCGAVILLLDCCYAGAIGAQYGGGIRGETAEAIQQQLRETAKARGLFILTSSTAWQTSEEVEDERDGRVMGRFTRAVAARLNAVAPDLPAEVRFSHLAAHVETAFPGQDTRKFFVDAQGDPVIARLPPRETAEERRERRLTGWMADGVLPPHVYGPAFEAIHGRGPAALVSLVARLLDAPGMTAQAFVAGVRNALPGEVPPPFPPIIERGPPAVPVASPAVPAPPASVSRRPRRWLLGLVASAAVAALVYSQVPPSTTEPPTRAEATATKPETAAPAPAVSASPDKPAVATALTPPKPAPGPTDTQGSNMPATAPPAASPTMLAPATPPPGGPDKPAGTAPATSSTSVTPAKPTGPINPAVATPPALLRPGTVLPRDCTTCPDNMVVIPGGTFTMGSPKTDKDSQDNERPQRQVTVASFAAGRFEVTRREFAAFIEANAQRDMGGCTTRENGRWQYRRERSWRDPGFASIQQKDDDHLPARLVSLLGSVSRFKQTDDDP
ncbi:MAG: SUMF1/EgtB/PvdO family nonheme iron enzyme, partial [Paracraurococcus sp.]